MNSSCSHPLVNSKLKGSNNEWRKDIAQNNDQGFPIPSLSEYFVQKNEGKVKGGATDNHNDVVLITITNYSYKYIILSRKLMQMEDVLNEKYLSVT